MNIDVKRPIRMLAIVAMFSLLSCGDQSPPVSQSPKPVSKKIATQAAAQPSDVASAKSDVKPPEAKADESQKSKTTDADESTSDLVEASLKELASTYDPKGRFDPFEPLFKDEPEAPVAQSKKSDRKRRIAQTPLERISLSQLKLSAIIRAPSGNRALVEDATGKGYVVTNGTYIGLNSGKVVQITQDRIVVEEEIENVLGELTLKNSELKLQKPAGEL
jgi:type IV pilus assembly protein PilP